MKIRALVPTNEDNGSSWWRIQRPFLMLRQRGHDATWHSYETDLDKIDLKGAVVVLHCLIFGDSKQKIKDLKRRGAISVVYSLDDYTFNAEVLQTYLKGCGGITSLAIERAISRIPDKIETMKECDEIVTTTHELAELVSEVLDDKLVNVIPNAIDEDWYIERLSTTPDYIGNSNRVYIGWAGGRRPESDLALMARAWRSISEVFSNVWFVVAGWQPDIIDQNIPLERKIRIPFAPFDKWPQSMQVDIGCCPLPQTEFNRGKTPIKYFEYGLAGACVVADKFYESEITSGLSGVIVQEETAESWIERLQQVIIHENYRKSLAMIAQNNISKTQSLKQQMPLWEFTMREFANEN